MCIASSKDIYVPEYLHFWLLCWWMRRTSRVIHAGPANLWDIHVRNLKFWSKMTPRFFKLFMYLVNLHILKWLNWEISVNTLKSPVELPVLTILVRKLGFQSSLPHSFCCTSCFNNSETKNTCQPKYRNCPESPCCSNGRRRDTHK